MRTWVGQVGFNKRTSRLDSRSSPSSHPIIGFECHFLHELGHISSLARDIQHFPGFRCLPARSPPQDP